MRTFLALLVGLSVTAFAPQALAQDAQRDAAIRKCIAQAHKEFPGDYSQALEGDRAAAYAACMTKEGQRP
jgi:hypothetical protein